MLNPKMADTTPFLVLVKLNECIIVSKLHANEHANNVIWVVQYITKDLCMLTTKTIHKISE